MKRCTWLVLLIFAACRPDYYLPTPIPPSTSVSATAAVGEVTLAWEEVPGALNYSVYWAPGTIVTVDDYQTLGGDVVDTADPTATISGLGPTDHAFIVTAHVEVFTGAVDSEQGAKSTLESRPSGVVRAMPLGSGLAGPAPLLTPGWQVASGVANSSFGESISVSGNFDGDAAGASDILIGSSTYGPPASSGRMTAFVGDAAALPTAPTNVFDGGSIGIQFGRSVAMVGDLNGDAIDDAVVGAPFAAVGGTIDVYSGGVTGLTAVHQETAAGATRFGRGVAGPGDLDGDAIPDVVVGQPFLDAGELNEGGIVVFFGGGATTGIDTTKSSVVIESNIAGAQFGETIFGAGDVDNNGFRDLLVGMPNYSNPESEGGTMLLLNVDGDVSNMTQTIFEPNQDGASMGASNSVVGGFDLNNDGFDDIAIGAGGFMNSQAGEGRVSVYEGESGGVGAPAQLFGGVVNLHLGAAVSAGDVNADGFDDVIAGGPGEGTQGAARLYLGSSTGLETAPFWQVSGPAGSGFGAAVAAGDINADGADDIVVGAPTFSDLVNNEGAAFVYFGPPRTGPTVVMGPNLEGGRGEVIGPKAGDVTFSDPASGTTWTCTWEWGDGTPAVTVDPCDASNVHNVQHAYASKGRYSIRLRVENRYEQANGRRLYGEAILSAFIRITDQ